MKEEKETDFDNLWLIILAAGKGKRMKAKEKNKVTYKVKGVPMITRTVNLVKEAGIHNILIVVGFAKESVISLFNNHIKFVEQKKRLGTGHAVKTALKEIPKTAKDVMVLYGDDSFLYSPKIFREIYNVHKRDNSKVTILTVKIDNPTGLGRVIRNNEGKVVGIIEEKDADEEQKKIKEINTACYVFNSIFLRRYIKQIPKSKITGEYYLPSLVELAVKNKEKIDALKLDNFKWRGVNTPNELNEAEKML